MNGKGTIAMSAESKRQRIHDQASLRKMLLELQDKTNQRIKVLHRDQEQESDSGPADELDSARTAAEVETHAGLIARAEEKLRDLDEAVARTDAGKYGRCLDCGEVIPIKRLMAIPFASYCVECQQKRNRAKSGWGVGTIIPPYDHQWTKPEEMEQPQGREYQSTAPEEQLTIHAGGPIGSPESIKAVRHALPKKRASRARR